MHYEEEKLEIQSNGQCIVKKKSWKYKVMDKKVDKWEKVAPREGGGGGGTRMFVLDVKSKLDRISCGYNFLY
jgi:hypothetical protein